MSRFARAFQDWIAGPGLRALRRRRRASGPRRLFVDVSTLHFADARTGIQRVVRCLLAELQAAPPEGYSVCPVYATPGKPWRHTRRLDGEPGPAHDSRIDAAHGDLFLGLDLSAHLFPASERRLVEMRKRGVSIHFVVYDLIPLTHPHFALPAVVDAFRSWIDAIGRHAHGLHCISETVAREVGAWMDSRSDAGSSPSISHFHLGADLPTEASTVGRGSREGVRFLMVGTIEPRKGHALVLDAFERLWEAEQRVSLIVVGQAGWMVDALVARMRGHAELGKRLHWHEAAGDGDLERLYRESDGLIAASEVEGFGLPLIESARLGLPILARDIPVFREVAGNFASYFSGTDADSVTGALRSWLERHGEGQTVGSAGMPWLTWRMSKEQLLRGIPDVRPPLEAP